MEGKILEAIHHVKSISKKKPSYKNIGYGHEKNH